jgi:hypothetical protein
MPTRWEESWDVLLTVFPQEWEQLARQHGAVERLRGFDSISNLLRTLLMHVGPGYSLRETVVRAKSAGLAKVSDVALLKRLRAAEEWWRQLCICLLAELGVSAETAPAASRGVRLVDATVVKEPGPTGSLWRLHYSLLLPSLECDYLELTATEGPGSAERLDRFPARSGELILGDRAYIHPGAVGWAASRGVDLVVRYNSGALPLKDRRGRAFPLLARLRRLRQAGRRADWPVAVDTPQGRIEGRLCVLRKSEQAAQRSQRKLKRRAQRNQTQLKEATLEYACYVIVWTSLSSQKATAEQVLELYRQRWQIELVFKRLKSLAQLGHLPKYDEHSSRAWLYGKLLLALLAQKLGRIGRDISPWGYDTRPRPIAQPVA